VSPWAKATGSRFVTGVDEPTVRVEQTQEQAQQGVCVEAYRTRDVVTVNDVASLGGRWKAFEEAVGAEGFAAVAGIPMRLDGDVLGVLNVYSAKRRSWSSEDVATAGVLADMATSYLVNASELEKSRRTAEQLEKALQSRIVIEQAKGVLAAERKIIMDQAFEALRKHARDHNASLRSVDDAVGTSGFAPERLACES
jgi:GAF domain-containing protein